MNGVQFEELCRFFVSERLGIPVAKVRWMRVPAAVRPGEPEDTYQVDLRWEAETPMGKYLTIAEAKWRMGHKVDRDDVLLLEQFRVGSGAHKAILLSNAEFTSGAVETARRLGIAVHQLAPSFSAEAMPQKDRPEIQRWLRERARSGRPLYTHDVKCKALRDVDWLALAFRKKLSVFLGYSWGIPGT